MYVYIQSEPGLYTVGFYEPLNNRWYPHEDFKSKKDAERCVHYLNGGSSKL